MLMTKHIRCICPSEGRGLNIVKIYVQKKLGWSNDRSEMENPRWVWILGSKKDEIVPCGQSFLIEETWNSKDVELMTSRWVVYLSNFHINRWLFSSEVVQGSAEIPRKLENGHK